jgi:hypothetical protein
MISTTEFQQQLQAGHIQEALALLVREVIELDVTTRLTEDSKASSEYLRTKINLLTGVVENEVGIDLKDGSSSYLELQQLHLDRLATSHRLVQNYLHQIKSILTVLSPLSPTPISTSSQLTNDTSAEQTHSDRSSSSDLKSASLMAKLTQANSMLRNNTHSQQLRATIPHNSKFIDCQQPLLSDSLDLPDLPQLQPLMSNTLELNNLAPIYTAAIDDEIDLSIDETAEVWEEWSEDADSISEATILQSPTVAPITVPNREERWVRRQLNPIDVKPISSRSTTESIDPGSQWDQFGPEYIGISADPQPQIGNNSDFHLMDRLLTEMDI